MENVKGYEDIVSSVVSKVLAVKQERFLVFVIFLHHLQKCVQCLHISDNAHNRHDGPPIIKVIMSSESPKDTIMLQGVIWRDLLVHYNH